MRHSELGSLVWRCSFSGVRSCGTAFTNAEKEVLKVRHFKDLNVCLAQLRAEHARDDAGPEQRKHLTAAMELLRVFRRLDHPNRAQAFRFVSEITDHILKAVLK